MTTDRFWRQNFTPFKQDRLRGRDNHVFVRGPCHNKRSGVGIFAFWVKQRVVAHF